MDRKWQIFAHEYVVSFFPVVSLVDSFSLEMAALLGLKVDVAVKIESHAAEYYNFEDNWKAAHLHLVNRIKKDPGVLRRYYALMEKLAKRQIKQAAGYARRGRTLTDRQLNKCYQDYLRTNRQVYSYGLTLPLLDYHETTFLSDELSNILSKRGLQANFNLLTTPLRATYNKRQELGLLEIFKEIARDKKLLADFRRFDPDRLAQVLCDGHRRIWSRVKSHVSRYAWTVYVYEGPAADASYFLAALKDMARRRIDPAKALAKDRREKSKLIVKQRQTMRSLRLSGYEKQIVMAARDAVFVKPYRRELQSRSYYLMEPLLAEIGRRLHLSLRQVRMMLPEEIASGLLQGVVDDRALNDRIKLAIYGRQGGKVFCLWGPAARKFAQKNAAKRKAPAGVSEISGATAYPGSVRGTVKLINMPEEMSKMKPGDILVSAATAPNLMPAIRQAAAIVTDEGGLTCHAAIVSRELKIPCVVGTKRATAVLKDGDSIEVDADKGYIKKLK